MYGTINEWNRLGRMVRKGEKCSLRTPEGAPLFELSQTYKRRPGRLNTEANDAHMRAHGYQVEGDWAQDRANDLAMGEEDWF